MSKIAVKCPSMFLVYYTFNILPLYSHPNPSIVVRVPMAILDTTDLLYFVQIRNTP